MEFAFNINDLLPDPITLVDDKLAPFRSRVKNDRLVIIILLLLLLIMSILRFYCGNFTEQFKININSWSGH